MNISEYMTSNPITVSEATPLPEARQILSEYQIRHLPVIDEAGRLIGILTDRDLRSAYPSSVTSKQEAVLTYERVQSSVAGDIMTTECSTLGRDAGLDDALEVFEKDKIGAIPIVEEDGKVVGLFSLLDLTTAYGKLFGVQEEGALFIAVDDDGRENIMSELVQLFEKNSVALMSIIRLKEKKELAKIYLRVNSLKPEKIVKLLHGEKFRLIHT